LLVLKKKFRRIGLDESWAHYLVNTYGKQSDLIIERFNETDEPVLELRLLLAELWFAVHYEMVGSSLDFFVRRTGRLYFDIQSVRAFGKEVVSQLADYLKWSEAKYDSELVALEKALHHCVAFKQ
ncbi:MAG TPA: glycerol-3-phosphate dehydrogenase C-terminal domain-containing protein, partial [Cyclobacteriaceae bacterium]|nr:glycerol-3-phosphate dehydrogenase C-terminal domain-containing protein [Cyclobacteriaceae bacterium]